MLNVAERAKKGKNRYISSFRACSGRRGCRFKSCYPDQTKKPSFEGFLLFNRIYIFLLYNYEPLFPDCHRAVQGLYRRIFLREPLK